jgi:hypothetical protein
MSGEAFYPVHRTTRLGFLTGLDGLRIPGGCDDCDAYQTVDSSGAPIYRITVHHDDTCPAYRQIQAREVRR